MSEREPKGEVAQNSSEALPAQVCALADQLVPVFYDELRRRARRERIRLGASTLQTTALVHEAYLRLRKSPGWKDEDHFLRAAALAMRHALVNHAEERCAAKRGSAAVHLPLDAAADVTEFNEDESLIALNEALGRLSDESRGLASVVECRYFGGYSDDETARALGLSLRTVRRHWALAKAWLHRELFGAF